MDRSKVFHLARLDRLLSWVLVLFALVVIGSGYSLTRLNTDRVLLMVVHTKSKWLFTVLLAFHFIVSVVLLRFRWRPTLRSIWNRKASPLLWMRLIQRLSGWALLITTSVVIISGLGWNDFILWGLVPFSPHLRYDVFFTVSLIVHVALGLKFALLRRRVRGRRVDATVLVASLLFLLLVAYVDLPLGVSRSGDDVPDIVGPPSTEYKPDGIVPMRMGKVRVGREEFTFDPARVETVRPDIFNQGFFSMFDVLVHLNREGKIEMEYHFDESMNTHVIDSINGEPHWWYEAYYDGGWPEKNVFRPDHYPWKDGTTLHFSRTDPEDLEGIYSVFREEVKRRKENNGRLTIPKVVIIGRYDKKEFENVEVTPHNLRGDIFKEGVITAIDVILSLGDQDEITYKLKWYESIGSARIVKDYWVEAIDDDESHGRCGFVYEAGASRYKGFTGNHIHLPSDIRVLNSPEYVLFFWICL